MRIVNVREARKHLSQLLDAAERGDTILIERYGRRVARLGPATDRSEQKLPDLSAFRATIEVSGLSASKQIVKERDEERA